MANTLNETSQVIQAAAEKFKGIEVDWNGKVDIGKEISNLDGKLKTAFENARNKGEGMLGKLNSVIGNNPDAEGVMKALTYKIRKNTVERSLDWATIVERLIRDAIGALNDKNPKASKDFIAKIKPDMDAAAEAAVAEAAVAEAAARVAAEKAAREEARVAAEKARTGADNSSLARTFTAAVAPNALNGYTSLR